MSAAPTSPTQHSPRRASWLARTLAPLRPRAWMGRIPGPVFQKEVWAINKRPSTPWIRMAYGLVLLGIVSFVFFAVADEARNNIGGRWGVGPAAALQQYQTVAPTVSIAVAWTQFVLITLVACALGAPAIADERRAGTLGTLLSTPVTAWQIVLGKLLGRMLELAILMLLSAPLLLAIRAFGGVPATFILATFALTFATALVAAQCSILLSIRTHRSGNAFISSVSLLSLPFVVVPMVAFFTTLLLPGMMGAAAMPNWVSWLFVSSSPGVLLFLSAELVAPDAPFAQWGSDMWPMSTGVLLLLWFVLFIVSVTSLRSTMRRDVGEASTSSAPRKRGAKGAKVGSLAPHDSTPHDSTPPDATPPTATPIPNTTSAGTRRRSSRVRDGASRSVGEQGILWRERELKLFRMGPVVRWTLLGGLVLGSLVIAWLAKLHEGAAISIGVLCVFSLLINASGVNAPSIAGEREGRTLDVLLCTPATTRDIVWQKFLGGLVRLWPIAIFIAAHFLLYTFAGPVSGVLQLFDYLIPEPQRTQWDRYGNWNATSAHFLSVPMVFLGLVGPVALLCASGVYFSSITQRSSRASVLNLLFAIALWVGMPMLFGLLSAVLGFSDFIGVLALYHNPFVIFLTTTTELFEDGIMRFNLPPEGRFDFIQYVAVLLVINGLYVLSVMFFLRRAAKRLRKGRA